MRLHIDCIDFVGENQICAVRSVHGDSWQSSSNSIDARKLVRHDTRALKHD